MGEMSIPPSEGIRRRNGAITGSTNKLRVLNGWSYQRMFGNQLKRHQRMITNVYPSMSVEIMVPIPDMA